MPELIPLFEVPYFAEDLGSTVVVLHDQTDQGADAWLVAGRGSEPIFLHHIERGDGNYAGIVAASENPTGGTVAVLDIRYPDGDGIPISTLILFDTQGTELQRRTFEAELNGLEWLDDGRLLISEYSEVRAQSIMVVDAITLDSIAEIENWRSARTVADGNILYGVWEGHLDRVDLDTGVVEGLTVFSNPVYGPLVVLPTGSIAPAYAPTPDLASTSTVPPATTTTVAAALAATGADHAPSRLPWILLGAALVVAIGATGVSLARRKG